LNAGYDLFIDLEAREEQIELPIVYAGMITTRGVDSRKGENRNRNTSVTV